MTLSSKPKRRVGTSTLRGVSVLAILMLALAPAKAESIYTQRPDDARAILLSKENFPVQADGVADDSDALQAAATRASGGILFIPEGRYRISKTIYVPVGTRLIGFGKNRPVFVLGANTPGFQEPGRGYPFGDGKYMIHFAQSRQPNGTVVDASELDFNSAMSNIDFEVGEGNPSAVCIRFHVAQHSFLSHMDFKVGSGLAALEDIGNQASNLRISGGKYGIISTRTSPNWQFLLMDTSFENQSVAGVRTQDVGFSFVRCNFAHMPIAITVPEGQTDQIYGRDLRFEDIRTAGIKCGNAQNFLHQITLDNTACTDVPAFIQGATETIAAPGKFYVVDRLSAGLEIGADGREVGIVTRHKERALQAPAPVVPSDIPALPPMDQWFTVQANTDLQAAINEHRVLYFPSGTYAAPAPLTLKADTVLIGLHCARATISGGLIAPKDGAPFVSGLNLSGVRWMSGEKSVMDDINLRGGGGGPRGGGGPSGAPAIAGETAPADPAWLRIDNGGGGIFRNLWIESGPGGLRVENTSTRGKIYQLSNEHHNPVEVKFKNVQNWQIDCLQTEEESGNQATYGLDLQDCQNLVFTNSYMYRVSRTVNPRAYAIQARNCDNITFDNMHIFSQTRIPFDNAVLEEGSGVIVRARNFAHLVVGKSMKKGDALPLPPVFAKDAGGLEKLASGFSNATSLTTDDAGRVYFTDATANKILRWNDADKKADTLSTISGQNQPQVIGFVKPSTLIVAAFAPGARQVGAIGSVDVNTGQAAVITEEPAPRPGTALLLPVGLHNRLEIMQDYINHRGYNFRQGSNTSVISVVDNEHRGYFYAPNSNVALMAGGTGRPIMQASQLATFALGDSHYLTSEDDSRTWLVTLDKDLKLTTKLFAERGGNAVISDPAGNVYLAGDQVHVFDKTGKQIGILEVPERPSSLALGGADHQTLFITARTSLYAIRINVPKP